MPSTPSTSEPSALEVIRIDPQSRRRFLRTAGAGGTAGLAFLLSACGDSGTKVEAPQRSTKGISGDLAIVNYALTLEYLEADFYDRVVEGGLLKNKKLNDLAKRIGDSEQAHVDALLAIVKKLDGVPADKPTTHFDDVLAGGPDVILKTAALVENLGAAAYLGQAAAIESPEILAAALAIHTVEARHGAVLNHLIGNGFKGDAPLAGSIPDGAFGKPMDMDEVLAVARPFYS